MWFANCYWHKKTAAFVHLNAIYFASVFSVATNRRMVNFKLIKLCSFLIFFASILCILLRLRPSHRATMATQPWQSVLVSWFFSSREKECTDLRWSRAKLMTTRTYCSHVAKLIKLQTEIKENVFFFTPYHCAMRIVPKANPDFFRFFPEIYRKLKLHEVFNKTKSMNYFANKMLIKFELFPIFHLKKNAFLISACAIKTATISVKSDSNSIFFYYGCGVPSILITKIPTNSWHFGGFLCRTKIE